MKKVIFFLICFLSLFANEELVLNSANSFIITHRANDKAPFKELMVKSKAVIIFPSIKKIGFLLGGMSGDGVMITNLFDSRVELKAVKISGGSVGIQVGYEDTSLVIFILKDNIIYDIQDGKITISADASVSLGDIGAGVKKINDFKFSKDFYVYSTNGGFFAGASFGGAVLEIVDMNFRKSGYAYEQLIDSITKI